MEGRCIACPLSFAVPMVALNLCAFAFASADWVRIPFGKKISRPNLASDPGKSGFPFSSMSFSSCANGFKLPPVNVLIITKRKIRLLNIQ
jgi:hypothetical protein